MNVKTSKDRTELNELIAKERVKDELHELTVKLDKLMTFMGSDKFKELDYIMQDLLVIQLRQMGGYQQTLELRLKLWK